MDPNIISTKKNKIVIIAGVTGALGKLIASYLLEKNVTVKALVRKNSSSESIKLLQEKGAIICVVDYNNFETLTKACEGASCVVSALSGLREVIVEAQTKLIKAAVAAGVPRFIPSDFSIDFTKIPFESNRNLSFRKEFLEIANKEPIACTSILNGMFTELLTGEAPVILTGIKRIMYWGSADQLMDYTTMNDTAKYTAEVAIDEETPRFLNIAGEVASARGLQKTASKVYNEKFGLLKLGGLSVLRTMIKITRFIMPTSNDIYPPWQGMQYLQNMLSGLPKLQSLDNNRYPNIQWTSIEEVLKTHVEKTNKQA